MSVTTGRDGLMIYKNDGNSAGEYPGYTPTLSQVFTLAKGNYSIGFHPCLACGWLTATYNGISILRANPHGQGNCCGLVFNETQMTGSNYGPTFGARFAPTEPGRTSDGGSLKVGSSHSLFVGVNATSDACVRVTNQAHWEDPDRVVTTIPKSVRALSDFILEEYDTIGFQGDNQIIYRNIDMHVPTVVEAPAMQHVMTYAMSHYLQYSTFSVTKRINVADGTLQTVTPTDGNVLFFSETDCFLWETPDTSLACAVYYEISKLVPDPVNGSRGFMGTRYSSTAGHANIFGQYGHAPLTPGYYGSTENYRAWLITGTEAEVASRVKALHDAYP
jgi:hypothetical protein